MVVSWTFQGHVTGPKLGTVDFMIYLNKIQTESGHNYRIISDNEKKEEKQGLLSMIVNNASLTFLLLFQMDSIQEPKMLLLISCHSISSFTLDISSRSTFKVIATMKAYFL